MTLKQFEAAKWFNGCDKTVPEALRFLADHERPIGGQQKFNAEHLYQLAAEIERMTVTPLYRERIGSAVTAPSPEKRFVSASCEGERCRCGKPAEHKVEETIFHDDPVPQRHPLTSYLCHEHFVFVMGPAAK